METDQQYKNRVLELSALAGRILLENGAEIARVEETMESIASHYGVPSADYYILSNGIFTTSSSSGFAKAEFIPFKGAQLERVADVEKLRREILASSMSPDEAMERMMAIKGKRGKSALAQIIGSAVGSAGFCIIFGGSLFDTAAAFVVGALLWAFVAFVSAPYLSKMVGNILASVLATALCIVFHRLGFGENLGNMMIGSLIPLIPGIPFVNGIKDIGGEDYIAGTTRLLDALMVFFCIAMGTVAVFYTHSLLTGSMIQMHGSVTDPLTSILPIQTLAAFVGTAGFAVLFGVPSRSVASSALCATIGWVTYLVLARFTPLGIMASTILASILVAYLSRRFARIFKVPSTVFLIPSIFPMVPGGGIFWTCYYMVSSQFSAALSSGFLSIKITIAIVLGIIVVTSLSRK